MNNAKNRKLLDIIITHYNEPWEIVRPGLDLLRSQVSYDPDLVRVTIIHDGSSPFTEINEEDFPFTIRQVGIVHGGVSRARNHGIDISNAEWITFYDCDDSLSSVYSLGYILRGLKAEGFNFLWHAFSATNITNPKLPPFPLITFNVVWMAAKYFRLDFLNEHRIRFNEELAYSEDGAFAKVAYLHCKEGEIGEIVSEYPLYTWRRRMESATMNDNLFTRNVIHAFMANKYVSEEFLKCGRESAGLMMARTVTDVYMCLQRKKIIEHPEASKELVDRIRSFIKEYQEYLEKITEEQWAYVLNASENEAKRSFVIKLDRIDFDTWYKQIKEQIYEQS